MEGGEGASWGSHGEESGSVTLADMDFKTNFSLIEFVLFVLKNIFN